MVISISDIDIGNDIAIERVMKRLSVITCLLETC